MDKEEPIFNIWGEISVSELVHEAAKVEQKYEKQQEKRRFAQLEEDALQQLAKNKCYICKQQQCIYLKKYKFKVYNTLCPASSFNANLGRTRL